MQAFDLAHNALIIPVLIAGHGIDVQPGSGHGIAPGGKTVGAQGGGGKGRVYFQADRPPTEVGPGIVQLADTLDNALPVPPAILGEGLVIYPGRFDGVPPGAEMPGRRTH